MNLYRLLQTVIAMSVRDLGLCQRCMRKSFVAAAAAWASLLLAGQWLREALVMIPLGILTAALALLWIAHLVVFSFRRAGAVEVSKTHEEPDSVRRSFLPTFAKVFMAAAAFTALPQLASAGQDNCERCTSGRRRCSDGCGDVSNNPDPQAHHEWSRCRNDCRKQYDCTDPCEHPSDEPDQSPEDGDDQHPPKKPRN
jgi:hypothetical protein